MAQFELGDHMGNQNAPRNSDQERLAASHKCYESLGENLSSRYPMMSSFIHRIQNVNPGETVSPSHVIAAGILNSEVECSAQDSKNNRAASFAMSMSFSDADDIYNK